MNSGITVSVIGCVIALVAAIFMIYWQRHGTDEYYTTEVVTSEDDPELKAISEFRTTIVEQLIAGIIVTWNVPEDGYYVDYKTTGFNSNIIVVSFSDFLYRIYCDWNRNKIRIEFSYYPLATPQNRYVRDATFRIKHNFIDFSKVETVLRKWYFEFLDSLNDTLEKKILSACGDGAAIAKSEEYSDEEVLELLFDAWNALEIRKSPRNQYVDTSVLTRLVAYIMRFHKDKFTEYIEKQKKINLDNIEQKEEEDE